jgi:hypothetical protein
MSDHEFISIFNEKWNVMLAVKDFTPSNADIKEYPVVNENNATHGIRADWRFAQVAGGYKILLDPLEGEPLFYLALDITSDSDLKDSTKLKVIRSDQEIWEDSDLWALVGPHFKYIISLAKDASTVYAIDAGANLHNRTHVWTCVAGLAATDRVNQYWEINPIPTMTKK